MSQRNRRKDELRKDRSYAYAKTNRYGAGGGIHYGLIGSVASRFVAFATLSNVHLYLGATDDERQRPRRIWRRLRYVLAVHRRLADAGIIREGVQRHKAVSGPAATRHSGHARRVRA